MWTLRVTPRDCRLIQQDMGAVRFPTAITRSGHGAKSCFLEVSFKDKTEGRRNQFGRLCQALKSSILVSILPPMRRASSKACALSPVRALSNTHIVGCCFK